MDNSVSGNMLCFVSSNQLKMSEVKELFTRKNIAIACVDYKINEIQCLDMKEIVSDKVKKAFRVLKRPVFVEQTGLYIEDFGDLPGGLTETVWNSLGAEKFCDFFGNRDNVKAKAITVIGYCDGKTVQTFEEISEGIIAKEPSGTRDYQWDCIFIPKGEEETVASLRKRKRNVSIRYKALMQFLEYIGGSANERTDGTD